MIHCVDFLPGIFRILIDNFNFEDTKKAVEMIGDFCQTESSGGITLETARTYADCGVDCCGMVHP